MGSPSNVLSCVMNWTATSIWHCFAYASTGESSVAGGAVATGAAVAAGAGGSVAAGAGVAVGGTGVAVGGTGVAVGGIGVFVGGAGVAVGGTGVAVGGIGVFVGGTGVAVGSSPAHAATARTAARTALISVVRFNIFPPPDSVGTARRSRSSAPLAPSLLRRFFWTGSVVFLTRLA